MMQDKGLRLIPVTPTVDGYSTPTEFRKNPSVNWDSLICKNKQYQTYGCFHSSYYIIDIDVKHEKNGWDAFFSTLLASINFLPEFITVSKSGGAHLYFKCSNPEEDQNIVGTELTASILSKINASYSKAGLDYKPKGWVRGPESSKISPTHSTYASLKQWIEANVDGTYSYVEINPTQQPLSANEFLFLLFANYETGFDVTKGSRDTTAYLIGHKLATWVNPKMDDLSAMTIMKLLHDAMPDHTTFNWSTCKSKYVREKELNAANVSAQPTNHKPDVVYIETRDNKLKTKANIIKAIMDSPWIECKYDELAEEIMVRLPDADAPIETWELCDWRYAKDKDAGTVEKIIIEQCGVEKMLQKGWVEEEMKNYAEKQSFHPLKQYIESVSWDGVPRVDNALHTYLEAYGDNDDYIRFVSKSFFLSLIARCYDPGCQVHTMMILEGPQGAGKSSFLRMIGDKWFTDTLGTIGSEDVHYNMKKFWLIEMPELANMKRSDVETVKAFITRTDDIYRPKYGRLAVTNPRKCVFAGTTNADQYLVDTTGNRRFFPVKIRKLETTLTKSESRQLLAEALVRYKNGENWYEATPELLQTFQIEQKARMETYQYLEDKVTDYLYYEVTKASFGVVKGVKRESELKHVQTSDILDIYGDSFGNKYIAEKKIAAILKDQGYELRIKRIDGVQRRLYVLVNRGI